MNEPQIEFERITKRYNNTIAVDDISLSISAGEFVAIMGSSGCGKTTTLRMLAGLEVPTDGEIRLDGKRLNELKPHERETPMVWQSLALFPFLNVQKNVEFGLKTRGISPDMRKERAKKWLEKLEIADLSERRIDQLSGGQRQRVALARALVTEPPVLLLDEPLSALDANLIVRMQSVLSRLQRDLGITFVYVTHSQSEAFAMADRVVIMSKGKIEQVGTPQDVFRRPASRFVAEFVGSNNIISGTVKSIDKDILELETSFGAVFSQVSNNANYRTGNPLDVVISADRINLSTTDLAGNNVFQCRIVSEQFVGSIVSLLLELENGQEFRVQKQQHELDRINLQSGQTLWLSWSTNHAYILDSSSNN